MKVRIPCSAASRIIRRKRLNLEGSPCHILLDFRQVLLGNGKGNIDGVDLVDGQQANIVCLDDVALWTRRFPVRPSMGERIKQ